MPKVESTTKSTRKAPEKRVQRRKKGKWKSQILVTSLY
jgi:hypothetical protein